ncbi:MAG: NAD(P)-dependent oxidoreductase [Paracoccaceae bacterium]
MRVGFVGLGAMGRAMAGHVLRAGHDVIGIDIDAEANAVAAGEGIGIAADLAAVVRASDVIIVIVVTDAQSTAVVDGLLAADPAAGQVIAIAATNHPDTMIALEARAAAKGVGLIDAPVVFGLRGAIEGDLGTLCGGDAVHVEKARPALAAYSRFVEHIGGIGAGQLAKTCNNMLHWAFCVANYEVLALSKRFGVPAARMREILLKCPSNNGTLERWDSTNLTWHEKDMDVALEMAQAGALSLPLFGQVDQLVKRLDRDRFQALIKGEAVDYLGQPVVPLSREQGGYS